MRILPLVLLLFVSPAFAQDPASPQAEHLSPYGLKGKFLLLNGEKPKDLLDGEMLTVVDVKKDRLPAGLQLLNKVTEEPKPGSVGIHIPSEAYLLIDSRKMTNVGKGKITIRLAKSKNREARHIDLEGKRSADYNEMRRCAADRLAGSPYPPKEVPVPNVPNGTLVIVGGGGMPTEIAKAFVEAGGGSDGEFVFLPISMPDPIKTQPEETFMRKLGAKNVHVIPFREQKDLEDPKTLEILKKATGIWFGGGRQWNFMDAYEGTKLPDLFREVLKRGGVIGGSSAGATIQGDYMVRGAPAGPNIMMCEGYERALAFLPGTAIDQHFTARNRFKDMTGFMKAYPQFLGIGLDEATAIIVRGTTAEIMGKGKVHFYDRRKPVVEGEPDYEAYPAGTKYDLKERKVLK